LPGTMNRRSIVQIVIQSKLDNRDFFNPDFALTRLFVCARRFPSQIALFNKDSPTSNPEFPKFRPEAQNVSERLVFDDLGTVNACSGIVRGRDGIPAVGHRKESACGAQHSTPGGWDRVHAQGSGGVLPGKLREKSQQHSWQRTPATLGQMWSSCLIRRSQFPSAK
jgi:hypothetical protein